MRRYGIVAIVAIGAILAPLPVIADVVGTNVPATPLTVERISALPAPPSAGGDQMPLDREASWYATL